MSTIYKMLELAIWWNTDLIEMRDQVRDHFKVKIHLVLSLLVFFSLFWRKMDAQLLLIGNESNVR